ncbi:MAG: sugar kinase, partial [Beduini sp.]
MGKYILKHLENEGIKTDLISINPNYPTGMMMKNQVEIGDPMIYYYRQNSAFSHYDLENIKHIDFSEYDQLHITGIPLALSKN